MEDSSGHIDKIVEEMELAELQDMALLAPRDFARLVGMSPQLVYYHIRKGHLQTIICDCGRKVIRVEDGLKALGLG